MTSSEIRQQFLDFFASKQHLIVPSAPIVVKNDPTLLFTNAGMNQFKDYFLDIRKPEFTRVADTQKCLRVSGKHNDLEEVGVDTYHHTMFEMLGNWSFGDYFKHEAIAWSWELLTEVYKIPKDRLYVTVFEGDEKEKLPPSSVALQRWKELVPEEHIVFGNKKDNFWEMGDTGPCGPCTEIHVDMRSEEERTAISGRELVNKDHPEVIEIWNNVFIQFNRLKDGRLEPLPAKHVDTGMGFERLVRVIQNKSSNYDTDVFTGTIERTAYLTGKVYDGGDSRQAVAFRVIADHIRAIAFTIADGQLPSNTGAGYVIRRILRRAARYYFSYLDYKQPMLHQLMPLLAEQFKGVFPELQQQLDFVVKVVKEEEEAFLRTLGKGLKKMDELMASSRAAARQVIPGQAAFELFDTFGFPIDLTRLIAAENKIQVDEAGFKQEMQQQKDRSRAATTLITDDWIVLDDYALNQFVGYDSLEIQTKVVRYRKVEGKGKQIYQLVLEATPFYAESGGQVGDKGVLQFDNEEIRVIDTKKENNQVIHFVEHLPGHIDGKLLAKVNNTLRRETECHHSATHLMHAALRAVLGNHVAQKGSLVNSEYLRFDFSHFAKVTPEEIQQVEQLVNEKIRANLPVVIKEMNKEEALALGAMALFGEKYGDTVRVVIMDPGYSVELCGGTHVSYTGELGLFKIRHETAVAAGVRRIEAECGTAAYRRIKNTYAEVNQLREVLKNPKDLVNGVEQLLQENSTLKKRLESVEARQLVHTRKLLEQKIQQVNNYNFIGEVVEVGSAESLKKLAVDLKSNINNVLIILAANIEGKANVAIHISETLATTLQLDAVKIIKQNVAPMIKGGGGGQKLLATAGGQDNSQLDQVIEQVKALLVANH